MSKRVDFYLLDQNDAVKIAHYSCRLLNKAYAAGMRSFVLSQSVEQARMIDQLLWVSSDANFIPHALAESAEARSKLTKICIGTQLPDEAEFDFLLCFTSDEHACGEQFARVAELVSADEHQKAFARKRYASWRTKGAELNLHRIQLH